MDFLDLTVPVLVGIAAVLAVYWFVQRRRPVTFSEAATLVIEAERVARILVAGAQQIFDSNQTHGVDQRYEEVEAGLLEVFPQLEPRQAKRIIEAAVFAKNEAQKRGWLPASGSVGITPLGRPQSGGGEI